MECIKKAAIHRCSMKVEKSLLRTFKTPPKCCPRALRPIVGDSFICQYYCMVYRSSLVRSFRSRVGFSKCWKCSFSPPCRQIRDRQTKEVLTHGNHSKDFGMPQDTKCQLFGFQGRKRQLCRVQLLCK